MHNWEVAELVYTIRLLAHNLEQKQDKTRESERSRIVAPAIRQAVENKTSEIMEATTGRGEFFELSDDAADVDGIDVEMMKKQLHEDLKRDKADKVWSEVDRNAEVFGLGIAEIHVKSVMEFIPATQPLPGGAGAAIGVMETERTTVPIKSIHPRNFLWDPNADSVDEGLGVAVEEYTSLFKVVKGIEDGIYRKVNIGLLL